MNLRSLLMTSLALTLTATAHAQTAYTVAMIGGSTTTVFGISRDGLKTTGTQGSSVFKTNNNTTPFLLGTGQGFAVSNFGEVAGTMPVGGATHAAYWNGTVGYDLGTLGGLTSLGAHINTSAGDLVGVSYLSGNVVYHAFRRPLWSGMQDLGSLIGAPGKSVAHFVTEEGTVLGMSETLVGSTLREHACQWDTNNAIRDLDPAGTFNSVAYAATHSDAVMYLNGFAFNVHYTHAVGQAYTGAATSRARMWTTNDYSFGVSVQSLPALASTAQHSVAYGINGARTVVGFSDTATSNNQRACRWKNGVVVDLNTLMVGAPAGTVLRQARGISEDGKIVVQGTINGSPRSFLLTPQ